MPISYLALGQDFAEALGPLARADRVVITIVCNEPVQVTATWAMSAGEAGALTEVLKNYHLVEAPKKEQ